MQSFLCPPAQRWGGYLGKTCLPASPEQDWPALIPKPEETPTSQSEIWSCPLGGHLAASLLCKGRSRLWVSCKLQQVWGGWKIASEKHVWTEGNNRRLSGWFSKPCCVQNHLGMVNMHGSGFQSQRFYSVVNILGTPSAYTLPTPKRRV